MDKKWLAISLGLGMMILVACASSGAQQGGDVTGKVWVLTELMGKPPMDGTGISAVPKADPVPARIEEADTQPLAGFVAADEGHLDRAWAEFDAAVETLLGHPGGALSEPRVAEAYRRTLDTVHAREIELLALGDGFTETAREAASIDEVGALPVGEGRRAPRRGRRRRPRCRRRASTSRSS